MRTPSDHLAAAERKALCDTLVAVGPDAPTLCMPWTTRDLAAHLVVREGRPDLAAGILVPFLSGRTEREQAKVASRPWPELVEDVRSGPPAWHPTRIPAVDDAVNITEMVVHHEDVLRGDGEVGPRREVDERLSRALWTVLGRLGRPLFRRVPVGVELRSPGREPITVRGGDDPVVLTGAPLELLLTAYGRRQVADIEVTGPDSSVRAFEAARLGI